MSISEEKTIAPAEEKQVIAKIHIPEIDEEDVETWFICLKAAFSVNNVISDRQRFNTIIMALKSKAKHVSTAIAIAVKQKQKEMFNVLC